MSDSLADQLVAAGMSATEAVAKQELFARAREALREIGVQDPAAALFVPGRIEVLGKHTDYAGGRSLLCAVERGFCVVFAARSDAQVRVLDAVRREALEFPLHPDLEPSRGLWSNYPLTVARRMARDFPGARRGADIAFASDLPAAAGLSSSSALIVSAFLALAEVNQLEQSEVWRRNIHSREDLAAYLAAVESGRSFGALAGDAGVGTLGGAQDHTAILCCQPGRISRYSFCPTRAEGWVALPEELTFVVGVSGIHAAKTGNALTAYNRAASAAQRILALWNEFTQRRDTTLAAATTSVPDAPEQIRDMLKRLCGGEFTAQEILNRFDQFEEESNMLVPAAMDALKRGDMAGFGKAVKRSHELAVNLLGNQTPETIYLARSAREMGAPAASAFGGGFGGSVWALVKSAEAEEFTTRWSEDYQAAFPRAGKDASFFITRPGPAGVRLGL